MDEANSEKLYLLDTDRWIGQFNDCYHRIIELGDSHVLDKANEVLAPALDKLEAILREQVR